MEVYRIAAKLLLLFSICVAIAYSTESEVNTIRQSNSSGIARSIPNSIDYPTATPEVLKPPPAPPRPIKY